MAKYMILKNFTDKYDKSIKYKAGKVEDFTEKRANEILSVGKLIEKVKVEEVIETTEEIVETTEESTEEVVEEKKSRKRK